MERAPIGALSMSACPIHWPGFTPPRWPGIRPALTGVKVADLRKVQQEVDKGNWRENIQTRDRWVGRAVARAMGLDADSPADRTKIKGLLAVWIKTGALKTVDRADAKREIRTFVEVGEWVTD